MCKNSQEVDNLLPLVPLAHPSEVEDNGQAAISMLLTDFDYASRWVRQNTDRIDSLLALDAFPYPWTYAYQDRGITLYMFTPIDMAVIAGRRDIVEKLIANGARTDYLEDTMDRMRWKPEDVRAVLDLLPDQRPGFHRLSRAILRQDVGELEALLDQGGDPNSQQAYIWNDDGTVKITESVLEVAVSHGDLACVALLLRRGALIRPEAMARAVERGGDASEISNLLLSAENVLPVHIADANGWTPLYRVVGRLPRNISARNLSAKERYALALRLIEHGADVNAAANDETTPLWIVCDRFDLDPEEDRLLLASLLIRHGADVNVVSRDNGTTPLMFAAARGDLKVISLLLDAGAHPKTRDHEGSNALYFARRCGRDKAAEMLREAGANTGWEPR